MDGHVAQEGHQEEKKPPITDPAVWEAEFKQLVGEVETAAREWGVRPDSLEGRFVSALLGTTGFLGRLTAHAQAVADARCRAERDAAELEVHRAREVTKAASLAVTQARNAQIALTVQQEIATARLSEQIVPVMMDKLKDVLVIRAKQWNTNTEWRRYGIVVAVTLMLVSGGYALRVFQDASALSFADGCLVQPQFANGAYWCDVTSLVRQNGRPTK